MSRGRTHKLHVPSGKKSQFSLMVWSLVDALHQGTYVQYKLDSVYYSHKQNAEILRWECVGDREEFGE